MCRIHNQRFKYTRSDNASDLRYFDQSSKYRSSSKATIPKRYRGLEAREESGSVQEDGNGRWDSVYRKKINLIGLLMKRRYLVDRNAEFLARELLLA